MADQGYPAIRAASLFILSAAIIAHQLVLMQILSFVQWYHFAYMVVALALLGFGASGTFFSLAREYLLTNIETVLPMLVAGCGLSMVLALAPSTFSGLQFDLYLLFTTPGQPLLFSVACLLYCLPFFLGGLAIALALTADIDQAGYLYFANLSGSGVGGLLGLALINLWLPGRLPPLVGLLPLVAAAIITGGKQKGRQLAVICGSALICLALVIKPTTLRPSQFKDVSYTLNLYDAEILAQDPSPYGLLQVISAESIRNASGLSLAYKGDIPGVDAVLVNGDRYGSLVRSGQPTGALLEYSTEFAGYLLARPESVLLLRPGGNQPIENALAMAAGRITAVEPHPGMFRLLKDGFGNFRGYGSGGATIARDDPRAFLARTTEKYGLIRFPTAGAGRGSIGMQAINEQYIFTRQAFQQGFALLRPDGAILAGATMDYPARNPLKILATLIEAAEASNIARPEAHIAAIRGWGSVSFILKKSPVTGAEAERLLNFCTARGFDPLLLPGLKDLDRERFHKLQDQGFFDNVASLLSDSRTDLYLDYDFNISPATDSRPYFSQFLRFDRLAQLTGILNLNRIPFFEMGSFILAANLALLLLLSIILIIAPLFRLRRSGRLRTTTLLYFGGLGLGYMTLEIVLIQNFILFLGQPLTATAIVICALLFSSGLGSLFSQRLAPRPAGTGKITISVVLIILCYALLLPGLAEPTSIVPPPLRLAVGVMIIALPGFLMGMLFPLGLRILHRKRPDHVPWAWGINGCLSVIGPPLATVVAVQSGFGVVFFLAATSYLLAFCSTTRIFEEE